MFEIIVKTALWKKSVIAVRSVFLFVFFYLRETYCYIIFCRDACGISDLLEYAIGCFATPL